MNDNARTIRFSDLPLLEKLAVAAAWFVTIAGVIWFVLTVKEAIFG